MALDSYSNIRTALTTRLAVTTSDISNTNADDILTEAEDMIYSELRVRDMETALSSTISSGVIAVPSDFCEWLFAYVDSTPVQALQTKAPEWVYYQYPNRASYGKPKFIAREVNNFIFGPYPDSTYTIKGVYYAKPTSVINGTLSGILLKYPGLLLYKGCELAEEFLGRDERAPRWGAKYERLKNLVEAEYRKERMSGPLQIAVA